MPVNKYFMLSKNKRNLIFRCVLILPTVLLIIIAVSIAKNNVNEETSGYTKGVFRETGIKPESDFSWDFEPESKNEVEEMYSQTFTPSTVEDEIEKKDGGPCKETIESVPDNYIPLSIRDPKGEEAIRRTGEYFGERINYLRESMDRTDFYYAERLLDESTGTRAFILAKDGNYAANLNGYFYYLFEESNLSVSISPMVLNISTLFDEKDRREVFKRGTYAQDEHLKALEASLKSLLGEYYNDDVYDFIYENYKNVFKRRLEGNIGGFAVEEYRGNGIEIVFHDSFITYIEFYVFE